MKIYGDTEADRDRVRELLASSVDELDREYCTLASRRFKNHSPTSEGLEVRDESLAKAISLISLLIKPRA